ncbi:helix-turn-helix domain-containing protein [Streptomyces actinomycinicus]|uniref:Helix-turn-helix domain-containing protein n=1 Tax=Streptomyces actinomycinicus TaxID=1695166 RepID=A0A937JN48_9ACTN|nr:helix-turn-helix transcriptional regulator [Streptomyces actinomycinicus]MBL1084205.1 helix-turn-helix domain-containing protein [Streptomyces actinomycinicus]
MISTDRQLKVMEEKLRHAQKSVKDTTGIEREVLHDLVEEMELEIAEYRKIQKGEETIFTVSGVPDLAIALIKARIAKGWTQAELARQLDKQEQAVQRDEAGGYERATLTRLADVADALGYRLRGVLEPAQPREPLDISDLGLPNAPSGPGEK